MPTLAVDDGKTSFYYEDAGPPASGASVSYTTLILIHGTFYTSVIFRPLIIHAKARNLRLIMLNQRDYPGTSPYKDTDIDAMRSPNIEVQRSALRKFGRLYGEFVAKIVKVLEIPPISQASDGQLIGGVSFLAWSSGNIALFQFLSSLDILSEQSKRTIRSHLRSVVVYEPAPYISGTQLEFMQREAEDRSSIFWSPLRDPTIPKNQKGELFGPWVSSYFTPLSQLPSLDPPLYGDTYNTLCRRKLLDELPTHIRISPKDMEEIGFPAYWTTPAAFALREIKPELFTENVCRSLAVRREKTSSIDVDGESWELHPKFKFVAIWCDKSHAEFPLGVAAIAQIHNKLKEQGVDAWPLEFLKFENTNHFAHWDDPEGFVTRLAEHI